MRRPLCVIALASVALSCLVPAVLGLAKADTPEIMDTIFEPMSAVLATSFDGKAFSAAASRPQVEAHLETLANNVGALEVHAKGRNRAFEFVAKSLGRDARSVLRWYRSGRYDEARFTLHNMTENCIACHSSLPESRKFPGADRFFTKVDAATLPPLERAHLQVMARQFDQALDTFETFFASRDVDPGIVPSLGAFTDYLRVTLGVKSDAKRPQRVIDQLLKRPAVPLHARLQLERWLATLVVLDTSKTLTSTTLDTPRRLMTEARAIMEYPRDRDGLVHYVAAQGLLSRYVNARPDHGADVGEAYYLLGIAESLLEHSFWLTRSDFYLESAIRLAPAATFSPKAYALLEESITSGYSGSSGTHVPEDATALLRELKQIVAQAHGLKI